MMMNLLLNPPLTEVDNHQLHESVVPDFLLLQKSANEAGISLNIASGYRSVERQLLIWNEKWTGHRPVLDRDGTAVNLTQLNDKQKLDTILIWSALPGASRHHWGTDLDVYDKVSVTNRNHQLQLTPEEYEADGPCGDLKQWMNNHIRQHGFYCPYQGNVKGVAFEPWHISHQKQAALFEKALTQDALYSLLSTLDIHGKEAILNNLNELYERFIIQSC